MTWHDKLRAIALAHGHSPAVVDGMTLRDLELLSTYATVELQAPWFGGPD